MLHLGVKNLPSSNQTMTSSLQALQQRVQQVLRNHGPIVFGPSLLLIILLREYKRTLAKDDDGTGRTTTASTYVSGSKSKKNQAVGVDARFWAQIRKLLPICIPGVASRESALLLSLGTILFIRTYLDIWFSSFNGKVVRAIVTRDKNAFVAKAIVEFGIMMWPLSICNNSLKMNIAALSLAFRERLTKHAHDQYFHGITFYKLANLDSRIYAADQLLTQDIDKFSDTMAHLYSDTAKPVVDIVLFAYKLGQALGTTAPVFMILYFLTAAGVLRTLSPPFGKYTATEQQLEGDFRFAHSRVIAHSEEIAFYQGSKREKQLINRAFERVLKHARRIYFLRFFNGIFDSVLVKYCATMLAYYLLARPVFNPKYSTQLMGERTSDPTKLMEDYSRNSGYLVNLSQAVGRVILAGRDLTRFAGYTSRVSELFDVLSDIHAGRYTRNMVSKKEGEPNKLRTITTKDLKGKLETQEGVIQFDKVPIITPNGDQLVGSLNMTVKQGMNVLVTGPNGCGKSSLFRILGELWPLFGGKVTKPSISNLFYVPQKPYLCVGTLRDQFIYPHTLEEALSKGYTDARLNELLEVVHLQYLVAREGGLDVVADWADVLSGGEKQRVAMARLFYHLPEFAILDECTSQVSMDVEGRMYEYAQQCGITLFTVSHRYSLYKYHEYLLKFDGEGNYLFSRMDLSKEIPNDDEDGKKQSVTQEKDQ